MVVGGEDARLRGCLTLKEVKEFTGLSMPTTRKLVEDSGAVVRVGRRVVVLGDKLDAYLHSQADQPVHDRKS